MSRTSRACRWPHSCARIVITPLIASIAAASTAGGPPTASASTRASTIRRRRLPFELITRVAIEIMRSLMQPIKKRYAYYSAPALAKDARDFSDQYFRVWDVLEDIREKHGVEA